MKPIRVFLNTIRSVDVTYVPRRLFLSALLGAACLLTSCREDPAAYYGRWVGTLVRGRNQPVEIEVHIGDGPVVSVNVVDQPEPSWRTYEVQIKGDTIIANLPTRPARLIGRRKDDRIDAKWEEYGKSYALTLFRITGPGLPE